MTRGPLLKEESKIPEYFIKWPHNWGPLLLINNEKVQNFWTTQLYFINKDKKQTLHNLTKSHKTEKPNNKDLNHACKH